MSTKHEAITLYADGAISPDCAGVGVIVQNTEGHVILLANRQLPPMTNNEAEYAGLLMGLEMAIHLRATRVEVRLDSEVVIYQMAGRFAVNSPLLKPLHRQACELARSVPQIAYTHVPRGHNQIAHALAAEAVRGRRWCTPGAPCSG